MPGEQIARRIIVSGRVQGVGFRFFIERKAAELPVTGFVRNLPTGQVEIWVEGDAASVEALVQAASAGPSLSRVDRLQQEEVAPTGTYAMFRITY